MKRIITCIMTLMWLTVAIAGNNVEVKIPDKCVDILLPDTASYIVFLTDQKTSSKDNQMRLKVASLKDGQGLWAKKFYPGRYVGVCDQGVLLEDGFEIKLYDFKTGEEIRKLTHRPVFIDSADDLMIGVKGSNSNKLKCSRLSTGETLWETKIDKNLGISWSEVDRPEPNTIIFQSDYIGKVNLVTGEIKTIGLNNSATDKKSFGLKMGASILGGALATLLTGGIILPVPYGVPHFYGLFSDMLAVNGRYYVADREGIYCFDTDLNRVWESPVPKGAGSRSFLYMRGDSIVMLNIGEALAPGRGAIKVGKPFRMSVNRSSGESSNLCLFSEKWDTERFGKRLDFVTSPVFILDDKGESLSLLAFPEEGAYLYTPDGNLLHVDSDLNILDSIDEDMIYTVAAKFPDGYILRDTSDTPSFIRTDSDGKIIETYDSENIGFMTIGNHIFKYTDDALILWDCKD